LVGIRFGIWDVGTVESRPSCPQVDVFERAVIVLLAERLENLPSGRTVFRLSPSTLT